MTAISAEGGTLPDHFTIVDSPIIGGDTLVQVDPAPHPNLAPILTVPQRGTRPAVETAVALPELQCFDDDRRDHQLRDDTTSSTIPLLSSQLSLNASPTRKDPKPRRVDLDALERKIRSIGEKLDRMLLTVDDRHAPLLPALPHSEPPVPSSNATNPALEPYGCTKIDALIKKVSRSLREDFLHLPATADPPNDDATRFQRPTKAALDLPPVEMDALEREIRCRSLEPVEPTPAPTSCHAPTTYCQPSDTPHHPQPALHPVIHPGTTITVSTVRPPAKPPDLTVPQQSVCVPSKKPSNHRKHRPIPPGPLAPPPKRARITSYFRPHPDSSMSPSPSQPLPPFNPVLLCTPDKYTQHNFRPP